MHCKKNSLFEIFFTPGSYTANEDFKLDLSGIPRVIAFVLEQISDVRQHYKLVETLMLVKPEIWKAS